MASGKLSAAAKRLSLTQSAISHALKRLRDVFEDELFVRTASSRHRAAWPCGRRWPRR